MAATGADTQGTAQHPQLMIDMCYYAPAGWGITLNRKQRGSDVTVWRDLLPMVLSEGPGHKGHTVWALGWRCPDGHRLVGAEGQEDG